MQQRDHNFGIATSAPTNAVAASVVLTLAAQPTATDTMTIGSRTYTWVTDDTADANGEINIGADLAEAKTNLLAAIAGTDGINIANTEVSFSAFATNNTTVTALNKGTAGNSLVSTETFTSGSNVYSAATLTGGINGTPGKKGDKSYYGNRVYTFIAEDDLTIQADGWVSNPIDGVGAGVPVALIPAPTPGVVIPEGTEFVTVASVDTDANDWLVLPDAEKMVGKTIKGWSAVAHEIRTPASSNDTINNVDADGTQEAAIPATTYWELTCVSTTAWILRAWDELGAPITAIVPD